MRVYRVVDIGMFLSDDAAPLFGHDAELISAQWKPSRGMVFFDVGTGPGMWSLYSAAKGCEVFAIDPKQQALAILKSQAELNKLGNIRYINKGCWSSSGLIPFGENSCLQPGDQHKTMIEVVTIDDISSDFKISRLDCINMDAEWAEVEIVKGAVKTIERFKPKLIIEVHDGSFFSQLTELVKPYGYKFTVVENFLIAEVK